MDPSRKPFRLERVRALRERKEDMAKEQLAASLSHRLRGEAMLRRATERVDGARAAQRAVAGGEATATDLLAAQAYLERVERTRRAAATDLDRCEAEVSARRAALADAARERQALERLKTRRLAEAAREAARRETAALDELALRMHRRRSAA